MITIYTDNGIYSCTSMYIEVYADNCTHIYSYGKVHDYGNFQNTTNINTIKENVDRLSKFEKDIYCPVL